jgi:hypothetical protein
MILDIFFDLIAAAGPFTVFYGMGQNSCSGKLLFRGLSSSDNSATFIEDSYGLTISSAGGGGGFPIDLNEIVYGTGTGITSSFLKVDNVNYAITGAGMINTTPRGNTNTLNSFIELSNSQIIGGKENLIQPLNSVQLKDSVILGGLKNCLKSNISSILCNSVIAGGTYNVMAYGIENSVILGGTQNSICTPTFNSKSNDIIHSSSNAQIYKSENSNIHSSCDVCMRCSCNSFISSSSNNLIGGERTMRFQNSSSVISSRCSQILATGSNNTIISSYKSNICGKGATLSTILSSVSSLIDSAIDSNIIGGNIQCIVAFGPTSSSLIYGSNIIGGYNNLIYSGSPNKVGFSDPNPVSLGKYEFDFVKSKVRTSTIIGGCKNCILFRPPERSIIDFETGSIVGVGELNSIIGGSNNEINISLLSTIIGGKNNKIICETLSAIMGGYKNYIYAGLSVGILQSGYVYSVRAGSGYNSIIGGRENRIYNMPDVINNDERRAFASTLLTSIIGSDCGEITRSSTSTIIGSIESKIQSIQPTQVTPGFTISNSTLISGCDNRICSTATQTSQETAIIAGHRNCISTGVCSNLKAFTTISSTLTRPQNSTASVIISSSGRNTSFPIEIKDSRNSAVISSCMSFICKSQNSVIIASTGSCIGQNVCNSVILASSNGLSLTWSNTVLVQNLLVACNTFVATASTNRFIKESAPGFNGIITSGTVNVRHGLITTI